MNQSNRFLNGRLLPVGIFVLSLAAFGQMFGDENVILDEVRIARVKSASAVPEADLTNMSVSLKVAVERDQKLEGTGYLVKFLQLDPIFDDTGKLLLTKKRAARIEALNSSIRAREISNFGGKHGPVTSFVLDAPNRGSFKIKKISGKIEVTPSTEKILSIEQLNKRLGKKLVNMELDGLKIIPQMSKPDADRITEVSLVVEGNHRRIIDWHVGQSRRPARMFSMSKAKKRNQNGKEVHLLRKSFSRLDPAKDTTLLLQIAIKGEKQVFDFSFENVILP